MLRMPSGIIERHSRGDSMRMGRSTARILSDSREADEEARLVLRHIIGTTRAALAEIDSLLGRAEWLLLHRLERDKSAPTMDERTFIGQAVQSPTAFPQRAAC